MQTYPPVTIEYSQTTETNLSLTSAWASGCVLLYPNHFLYNSLIVVIELSQSRTSRTHFEPVLTQCPSPEQACHCWFCSFKKKSSNLHFCNVVTLWCVHVPFCVSQNLFNQGLQFDLSSATFIRIVSKKKSLPQVHYIYTYDFLTTQILGLIFWLTLEISTTLNSLGCVNYLETKCWIDVRTYANQIHCVLQHSLTYRHCVLVYICEISG